MNSSPSRRSVVKNSAAKESAVKNGSPISSVYSRAAAHSASSVSKPGASHSASFISSACTSAPMGKKLFPIAALRLAVPFG